MHIITLLTDFGLNDVYVGVMKGAIASINPHLKVIDLTHNIPPQNLIAARFSLLNSYSFFPPETVHIAVIDPGVGSKRRGLGIKTDKGYFIGPDNGIFSGILSKEKVLMTIELNNSKYWRVNNPSNTFHGRDIFATVGAHLANGIIFEELGTEINPDSLVKLNFPEYEKKENKIIGYVQYIDYFGNIITNIPSNIIEGKNWTVKINNLTITKGNTYNDVKIGELISIIGSHNWLEIACNCGNAAEKLQLKFKDEVKLIINEFLTELNND